MSEVFKCACGCSFKVLPSTGLLPSIKFSPKLENLNLFCTKTWEMISEGNTKGCFQLESRLGQMMAKKLKPENIEQLAALISILRPGCLEAVRDNKTVSNHYIDKKNGLESVDYFHPSLEDILSTTYGEMIYQEQSMQIAQKLADFDLKEADMLRKAIGKKKPEEMAKIKQKFIEGCKQLNIVSIKEAEEIFGWIEKSQRYSFNKSHAISYAINAYLSAYAKAHFPKVFFAAYLKFAKDKMDSQQEIKELVKNANDMDIGVSIPDIRLLNKFFLIRDKYIYFGLTDIKGLGQSAYDKLLTIVADIDLYTISWSEFVIMVLLKMSSTASQALISSGALDHYNKSRTEMLFELNIVSELTNKESEHLLSQIQSNDGCSLINGLREILSMKHMNKKRKQIIIGLTENLINPPYSLVDKIEWLSDSESDLLGTSITCSKLDSYDIRTTNSNCRTVKNASSPQKVVIAGEIIGVNIIKTKTGKTPGLEMAFVSIEDQVGVLDSIIFFPEKFQEYKHHLFNTNVLVFVGNKTKTKDGVIVDKCLMPTT